LVKHYPIGAGLQLRRRGGMIQVVNGVDFTIARGETLGLVGESGCGEVPSPANPPSGCRFRTRCWKSQQICTTQSPTLTIDLASHQVACHFSMELADASTATP
jgi:ABC-type dipeptide/oligopeptide/nickel transport system ATPase component